VATVYAATQAAGQDDLTYIKRFREMTRDQPRFFPETFTGDGAMTVFNAQRAPINDDEFFSVVADAIATPWTVSYPPGPGQVYVEFDTGTLVFSDPPEGNSPKNVYITKRIVRWRDSAIQSALMDGLRQTFPALWTVYVDTSVTIQQDTYDYTLPFQFNDPAVRISSVAVQDIPSSIEPFRKIISWERVGTTSLHIFGPNAYTPGAVLRIEYMGPYNSLGDLQPQAYELPVLYAAGSLMVYGEARRSETNTQTVQGPEQSLPPGQMQAAGGVFLQQFAQLKANLERPMPMGGWRSTYRR
jgi:hypothetical protein